MEMKNGYANGSEEFCPKKKEEQLHKNLQNQQNLFS